MSAILNEILNWSAAAPAWQQDAARRLFQNRILSVKDDADLYAIAKAARDIPDPQGRTASTLTAAMIAPTSAMAPPVQMLEISQLRHVNALSDQTTLKLAPLGLTAIYGDNGSGKSGYARVLKKACRARDSSEEVLTNANLPPGQAGIPAATFTLSVGDANTVVQWTDGTVPPLELGSFAVFDTRCARHYIDEQGAASNAPYGMDILRGTSDACARLKVLLETEKSTSVPNLSSFQHLASRPGPVGALLSKLSAATTEASVLKLATLSVAEEEERELLRKTVNEPNPKDKAQQLRLRSGRLSGLATRLAAVCAAIGDVASTELRHLVDQSNVAKQAAELAAKGFVWGPEMLPGTGGEIWLDLFEAARKFAVEAYPSKTFPQIGPDAPCPLCQQPIGSAANKLVLFDAFIQGEAEKLARGRKEIATTAYKTLIGVSLDFGLDATAQAELGSLDGALAARLDAMGPALLQRRDMIKAVCGDGNWAAVVALPPDCTAALQALVKAADDEAGALDKLVDEKSAAATKARFSELEDRTGLAQVQQSVREAIAKMTLASRLKSCELDLRTNAITAKVTELNEKVITEALEKALNVEFKALGVDTLKVVLQQSGVKGKTLYRLALQKPGQSKPGLILSEGEQRAIAIASFLADLNLSNNTAGIIFDDPVSSLDHIRRWYVVSRLVAEAKKRQVVILTHDLYFLYLLQQECEKYSVPCKVQSLHRVADSYGVAQDGIPFGGAGTKERVKLLRVAKDEAMRLKKAGDYVGAERLVLNIYVDLRKAWERGVEEVLFHNVVVRFTEGVSTMRLSAVEVTDDDVKVVDDAMTRCSKFAHDGAASANVPAPSPEDLQADIEVLEDWRKETEERNKTVRARRGL